MQKDCFIQNFATNIVNNLSIYLLKEKKCVFFIFIQYFEVSVRNYNQESP